MKISLCTTCSGRLEHLRQTLPANLAVLAGQTDLEFVVLVYGCTETWDWLQKKYVGSDELVSGRLRCLKLRRAGDWHTAHAKNLAHVHARGSFLVNADADNFFTVNWIQNLRHAMGSNYKFRTGPRYDQDDSPGRLGFFKRDFLDIGGYNESLPYKDWYADDADIADRAAHHGIWTVQLPAAPYIKHSNMLRCPSSRNESEAQAMVETRCADVKERSKTQHGIFANCGRMWAVGGVRDLLTYDIIEKAQDNMLLKKEVA